MLKNASTTLLGALFLSLATFQSAYSMEPPFEEAMTYPRSDDYSANCCTAGNLVLSGELLYLKPSIEQSSYVISSTDNHVGDEFFPDGKRHFNRFHYKPGFRVEGLYKPCGDWNAVDVRFAYFRAGHSDSFTGPFLYDTIGFPGDGAQSPEDRSYSGTAKIKDRFHYYSVDATYNRLSLCSCIDNFYLLFGLHYANIQHKTHFTSVGSFIGNTSTNELRAVDNLQNSRSRFWGIGPQIGLDYSYSLTDPNCCYGAFSLNANARGSLLCARTKASYHYSSLRTAGSRGVNLKNQDVWRVTPAFNARLSGSYQFMTGLCQASLEIGYEWLWYHNGVDSIRGIDVAFAGDTLDLFNNFSLHGPYARLNIGF